MSRAAWGIVAGLALVTVVFSVLLWAASRDERPAPETRPSLDAEAALREELEQARHQNRELEAQVAWLQAQVDLLSGRLEPGTATAPEGAGGPRAAPGASPGGAAGAEPTLEGVELAAPEDLETAPAPPDAGSGDHWFDEKGLLAAGLDPRDVERLKALFHQSEMEVIELEHQARREGWHGKPRYWRRMRNMRDELRAEIGDQDYDYVLYAAGRTNRVRIEGVLEGSPGYRAGLRSGDLVLSYEGNRVFKARELKSYTVGGELGQTVRIEVLRNGEVVWIYIPKGPMGAKLGNEQVLPTFQ